MTSIRISECETTIEFGFDDLVRYHGTRSICGLTVAFKIMETAWDEIWKSDPPSRENLNVASGFPGLGARDGFEMVTRAVSRDAYQILTDITPDPRVAEAAKGVYFFRLSDNQQVIEMALKPSVLPETFVPQRRKIVRGEASEAEKRDFRELQFAFSEQLRDLKPSEAVNILDIRPVSG
jgi:hypothetical protein